MYIKHSKAVERDPSEPLNMTLCFHHPVFLGRIQMLVQEQDPVEGVVLE